MIDFITSDTIIFNSPFAFKTSAIDFNVLSSCFNPSKGSLTNHSVLDTTFGSAKKEVTKNFLLECYFQIFRYVLQR